MSDPAQDTAALEGAAHLEAARAAAAEIPDIPADTPLRPVRSVAIVGAGTMGAGIAMSLAGAGIDVVLIDASPEALQRGLARVAAGHAGSVSRGRLTQADADARTARIRGGTSLADAAGADMVVEAVFEDMALKQRIFRELDAIAKDGAILATNTSGLDIGEIAAVTRRPRDVVGAHFFSPAHVQRLLEVVRTDATAPDVIATTMALGRRMGKSSVLARVYPGFIGNALFRQYTREAHFLVEDGALPHEVDAVLTGFGYAMGVFAVHDLAGNDVGYPTRKAMVATRANDRRWNDVILELVELGRLGRKSGTGWYRYDAGDRTPRRDPELERWLVARSARLGLARRPIPDDEILERCLYGMVNEGARLLEKGVALRPGDIDLVCVTGYGFPAARGGPMHHADRIGLPTVLAKVRGLHERLGAWWEPAPLLVRLAAEGRTFADLQRAVRA